MGAKSNSTIFQARHCPLCHKVRRRGIPAFNKRKVVCMMRYSIAIRSYILERVDRAILRSAK